ncbi:uveal autoantigen with coiled-coil domains and ankyrin repeats-like [Helianthus annuus]|uniref:uveal autoantigen with coiled-coil domains and ankyrin repeats-like n=1 Tax=Helianthus annuus TaxID=4232 RepID=UPI0016532B67|nr:uveal autoantigen with coiled-coil domains and ankyrin repeats-like [Helianthus annuus]
MNREREREREREQARKAEEEEQKSKKVDDGIIDTTKEMTTANLTKMAGKVLMAKELEVDSKSVSMSTNEVSGSSSTDESVKKTEELVAKVKMVEDQILSHVKLVRASNERIKELSEKIEKDKSDVERFRKENEKLIHENRQLSENHEKLKKTIKDSDERNNKRKTDINQQLDEIANLKLQFQEAKIENERINLKLNSYSSTSFVLQHIVPKPIGKNKAGEDVYSDGTGVGYHQVPPPMLNNFSKTKSGLDNDDETNDVKLPETIDVTFTSSSDEDSVRSEVAKNVVENVLKSDSDSAEDEECFLNNYIPKSKSQNNLSDEPTLCTNSKPKSVVVESPKKKDDVKGKAPMFVEKKVLQKENIKVKTEPVKESVTKTDKFYKRAASSQQAWKPKSEAKTTSSSKPKVSESAKPSSSTKKMYVPLDFYEKLEKQTSTPPGKKYVPKKDQSSGQPPEKEFFLYKKVEIGSEESLKMNDKNFPPLYTELPRSISRWIMDSGASRHMTGRKTLLYDVRGFNGGYVGFAGNQGGRIAGEGTLSNGVITFERVNYIAELENNLLSISHICDRMYSTHFMDKQCLILKPGFVIPEDWVIMRASRVNDLYVLDISIATTTMG